MKLDRQRALLRKVQEMEFVAVELNLYLDTHPCDQEAIHDFNCAAEMLRKYKEKYECEFGPLLNFGFSATSPEKWQWVESPWPWEL